MIKLIVSDMDGTLLNDHKQIDTRIYDLLPKMQEQGIRFVVASGRQYPSLQHDFAEHLKDIVIIAENGAFVVEDGKELYFQGMTQQQTAYWLDAIDTLPDTVPLLCAKYCGYTDQKEMYDFLSGPKFHYDMTLVEDLRHVTKDITKVSMVELGGKGARYCYDQLSHKITKDMTLVISGENCLDTGLTGVTKGSALQALQAMWDISPKETLVFGDQYNDVEMFHHAYYSYAMENAAPDIKQQARFIAGSNNAGGVVNAIQSLLNL